MLCQINHINDAQMEVEVAWAIVINNLLSISCHLIRTNGTN